MPAPELATACPASLRSRNQEPSRCLLGQARRYTRQTCRGTQAISNAFHREGRDVPADGTSDARTPGRRARGDGGSLESTSTWRCTRQRSPSGEESDEISIPVEGRLQLVAGHEDNGRADLSRTLSRTDAVKPAWLTRSPVTCDGTASSLVYSESTSSTSALFRRHLVSIR